MARTHNAPSQLDASKPNIATSPPRRWLGWDGPILPRVVQQLRSDYAVGGTWDMRQVMIVLPGGLARRRLGELLAVAAKQYELILYPPQIVTVGTLPEQLYVAKFPFASDLVQQLAWTKALQQTPTDELTQVVPLPPAKSSVQQWLELAKIFAGIHRELASDGLNFAQVVDALGTHPERERWQALAGIQARYLATLDGQHLWDIQTARLCALDFREPATDKKIIVVGCVDLNRTQRGFLEQIAGQVALWIAAPESAATMFDSFGGLQSQAWADFELDIPAESLLVGNSPTDQAELACACLAELADRYHAGDVTLGVPDAALVTELKQQLGQSGQTARYGPGTPLTLSEPALLLRLLGEYIDTQSFVALAALVRHPSMPNMFATYGANLPYNWLALLDSYYQAALPKQVDSFVNQEERLQPAAEVYVAVMQAISAWLSPLSTQSQPVSEWVEPLLRVMQAAYEKQMVDLDDPVEGPLYSAATQLCEAILTLRDFPSELEPSMTVAELIDWLLHSASGRLVPEPNHASAIEMLGWLELGLDDAPVLILTGIHDGVIPESANADAFLPNGLRRQLGMMDNARRYARDIYALQVMLRTREHVRLVVGKSDANGDPLTPSRLLMACDLAQLPERVLHLVKEDAVDILPAVEKRWKKRGGGSSLAIPRPQPGRLPRGLTVTAFRDFLACPYRYYLGHVLKLREEHDADAELDAPMFGNLLHDTLQLLGEDAVATSQDASEIEEFLIRSLHEVAAARFGPNPPSAVLIQIEQAEQRLQAFAPKQAERAALGWEIRHTEKGVDLDDNVLLGIDKTMRLIGRIDRIDYHPQSGRWAIWDYKTSDNAKQPLAVHWNKTNGWQDLQLPLYRFVARHLGVGENPSLGYIALPKQPTDVGFYPAEFTAEQLAEADELAHRIASQVANGEFWSDELGVPKYDNFARICQTNVQHVEVDPPPRRIARYRSGGNSVSAETVAAAVELLKTNELAQPSFEPLLIRASAGTGKTFQLTNRLLQIILSGQEVDSILASTFTRKAAGEIMHRVLQRLAQGCLEESVRQELSQHLLGVDTSAAACLAALRRVTRSIHRLRIGTLDSFFAQVARTFTLEMGLPPGWTPLDPVLESQVQLQAIGQMLDNHDRPTLVSLVRMLSKGESTRQISEQIRQTVAAGYTIYRAAEQPAWDQLPLPAPPSEQAVESALIAVQQNPILNKSGTVNKSALKQLEVFHLQSSTGDWEAVINHGVYGNIDAAQPTYYSSPIPDNLAIALRLLAERAAAELLPIRRNQTLASFRLLEAYDNEYTASIRRRRALAFQDVSYFLARWMTQGQTSGRKSKPQGARQLAAARLAFRLDCNVQHLLLDEFQDTAPEQWQILQPLAIPLGGASSSDRSFFCVGDTKQAIYGWRGGVAEIFDSVGLAIDEIRQTEMSESFRSSPEVMQAVNEVFFHLPDHGNYSNCDGVATRWSAAFPQHRTARSQLGGYVRLQNGPKPDKELTSEQRQAIFLDHSARQIAELTSQSDVSIGVLFRTNDDVGRMIALLRERGVAASQDGGNPLSDSVAVELMLSLIHLADHPGDRMCAFHVGTSPLAQWLPYSSARQPEELAHWFRTLVARCGLGQAIAQVADPLADHLSWWDQHRLEQLIRAAHEFQPSYQGRLRDFEEAILRGRVALPTEAQVKVMTVHKSKGLEFDAVFLPDLDVELSSSNNLFVLRGSDPCQAPDGVLRYMNAKLQTLLPDDWQRAFTLDKERGINESLCLLYVAMTRARQALYMTARPTSGKPLQSLGSLLQSTLAGGAQCTEPEAVLYELGSATWYRSKPSPPDRDASSPSAEKATRQPTQIALRTDASSAPVRGLRVAAPSSLVAPQVPIPLVRAFSMEHSVGATHGTLVHALFEQVNWLEDFRFDLALLRRVALASVEPEALRHVSLDAVLGEFAEQLKLNSVQAALSQKRYQKTQFGQVPDSVEIDTEREVSLIIGDKLIAGTIDRLAVLIKDGRPYAAEIFDFKTDQCDAKQPKRWLKQRIEHHRPQLEIYAHVVSEMFHLPRSSIATYLVMLASDDLVLCPAADS
ncbi:MAG: PD-(D/E)XK nuclease family protein [Pirellulaceae bacterium]|nr:PD-(D/E)XK nuclease family protein [Pirellulaceae bacterium]